MKKEHILIEVDGIPRDGRAGGSHIDSINCYVWKLVKIESISGSGSIDTILATGAVESSSEDAFLEARVALEKYLLAVLV